MALRTAITTVDEPETSPDGGSLAPAVTRAALILDALAEQASEPMGPSELARRLGLPKSSIANICGALAEAGLVRRVGTGFALGRHLAELGGAYLATVDQVQEFYEASRGLPTGSEETVQFAVLDGLEVIYLARHDGRQPVQLSSGIGRRLPAFSTATGKAALASLSDEELGQRLAGHQRAPTRHPQGPRDGGGASRRSRRDPATRLCGRRRGDHGRRGLLRGDGPQPGRRRGPVRRQHHAAQGPCDRRACAGPDRGPARPRRRAVRSRSGTTRPGYASLAVPPKIAFRSASDRPRGQRPGRIDDLLVGRGEAADRPIRSEHEPIRPEPEQRDRRRRLPGRRDATSASRPR